MAKKAVKSNTVKIDLEGWSFTDYMQFIRYLNVDERQAAKMLSDVVVSWPYTGDPSKPEDVLKLGYTKLPILIRTVRDRIFDYVQNIKPEGFEVDLDEWSIDDGTSYNSARLNGRLDIVAEKATKVIKKWPYDVEITEENIKNLSLSESANMFAAIQEEINDAYAEGN